PMPVVLPNNVKELAQHCRANDVAVVIIDPLLNHLTVAAEALKDFVRTVQVLTNVQEALEAVDAVLLGVVHYNKNQASAAMLDRLIGSKALATFPRAILGFGYDPEDASVRLVLQAKNNGGPRSPNVPTLAFTIESTVLLEPDENRELVLAPRLRWLPE